MQYQHQHKTVYDDTWGSDKEDDPVEPQFLETTSSEGPTCFIQDTTVKQGKGVVRGGCEYLQRERRAQIDRKQQFQSQIPSLLSICLGVFADNLDEVLGLDRDIVECIPPDCRACLFAVARFQEKVGSKVLSLMCDASWDILDVHNCSQLSALQITRALQSMPQIAFLDLQRCNIDAALIRSLGQICPLLRVLRLDVSCVGGVLRKQVERALLRIVPGSEYKRSKTKNEEVESWEELFNGTADNNLLLSTQEQRVCQHLEYLVLPGITAYASHQLSQMCPKLHINKMDADVKEAKLDVPLDQSLLDKVCGNWAQYFSSSLEEQSEEGLSMAEKFRRAIITVRGAGKLRNKARLAKLNEIRKMFHKEGREFAHKWKRFLLDIESLDIDELGTSDWLKYVQQIRLRDDFCWD